MYFAFSIINIGARAIHIAPPNKGVLYVKLSRLNDIILSYILANQSSESTTTDVYDPLPIPVQPVAFKDKHYGTIDVWWLYDDGGKI